MKTYKCDSCGRVIENPFEEKMKEFYYGVEADVFGVFPIPWKEKKKIHLCEKCFEGLAKIKYAGEKVSNNVIEMPEGGIGNLSDGYHTFNELYHHRAILFSVICNSMPEKAWKSKLHDTGDMFDGMFIVGIETPEGQATYHYDIVPYWDMFKVKELEKAPKWDGHTPQDAIERISKLSADVVEVRHGEWINNHCTVCGMTPIGEETWTRIGLAPPKFELCMSFCPCCGAKMDGKRSEENEG